MSEQQLSIEAFQELLDRYGGNLACWPAAVSEAAETLLARSPDARKRLEDARRLDTALGSRTHAPAGLVDRIIAASGAKPGKK